MPVISPTTTFGLTSISPEAAAAVSAKFTISTSHDVVIDASVLASVQYRAWQKAYRGLLPDSVLDGENVSEPVLVGKWKKIIENCTSDKPGGTNLITVRYARKIVGYCLYGPEQSEDQYRAKAGASVSSGENSILGADTALNSWELYSLYIDPDYQRQGLGTMLLEQLHRDISKSEVQVEIEKLIVWVGIPNIAARKFYEKHGAQLVEAAWRESAYGWKGGMVCYQWTINQNI